MKMDLISLIAVHAALLGAGPAGKATVAVTNPYVAVDAANAPNAAVAMAHPGQAHVRAVRDLAPIAGAPQGPLTTTEAARIVASMGAGVAQYVGAGVGA
jgi:hypothetical protein